MIHPNPDKRQMSDLWETAKKIGDILGLKPTPVHLMTWKEPRLNLENKGECYPLIDVLEKLAEIATASHELRKDEGLVSAAKPKRGRKKKEPDG